MEARRAAALVAVLLPALLYSFYRFSIGALVPSFEATYSIGDAVVGEIVSASVGLVALGVFAGGVLAQRLGDARTVSAGLVAFTVSEALVLAAPALWEFCAVFFGASFGIGLVITPSYGVIARLLPERRGLAVSLVSAAYSSGGFVGPSLAGYLAVYHGWGATFLALSLIGAAFTAFFAVTNRGSGGSGAAAVPVSFAAAVRRRPILVLAIADFFADLGFLVFVSWTPKYLISSFAAAGGAAATLDTVFGVGVGLGGFGALAAGGMFDRLGGRKSILACGGLSAASFVALYLSRPLAIALVIVLFAGFFANTFWPLFTAMAQVSVPPEQVTSATSAADHFTYEATYTPISPTRIC
ncbi:MAG: MFS transporter, partial [Nitrososphaerota archaeon]|nr:MFS transporter [Nitrososphaerota archaeon]